MDDKGGKNKRARKMLECTLEWLWTVNPLQLPPPLAVFFLIASWAISGSLFKWEVSGSKCSERVEGVAGQCVCVCGGVYLAQPRQ